MDDIIFAPDSPRSVSSELTDSPPRLDPSTLALLDDFLQDKADQERRFAELAAERSAGFIPGLGLVDGDDEVEDKPMMSVDEYSRAFGEDWQLSQFWYTTASANRLAERLHDLSSSLHAQNPDDTPTIAFLCCPTGFVAFQHHKPLKTAYLLEIDQRFSVLSPRTYFPYDMNQPTVLPKDLLGRVDLAIVDPAFLNEDTNTKIVTSLKQLLKPDTGRTVLITSTSIESILEKVYDTQPVGPIRRTAFQIEHTQLQNDFAVWGSWDGAENFGANQTS